MKYNNIEEKEVKRANFEEIHRQYEKMLGEFHNYFGIEVRYER